MEVDIKAAFFFIDLRGSREIFSSQIDSNKLLKSLADYLNKNFSMQLMTPFSVREGDALIGGTKDFRLIVDIYQTCLNFSYSKELLDFSKSSNTPIDKIKFYFGVGIGNISTTPDTYDNIEEINGSAISNAKEATEQAKKAINSNDDYFFKLQKFQFYAKCDNNDPVDKILNPMIYLIFENLVSNSHQNKLFILKELYREDKNYNLAKKMGYDFIETDVEERRKVSSQISNIIRKSHYELQKKSKIDLKNYLYITYNMEGFNK